MDTGSRIVALEQKVRALRAALREVAERDALAARVAVLEAERDMLHRELNSEPDGPDVAICYTNWRGETRVRRVYPVKVWYGSTACHPDPQWFIHCRDAETNERRSFALSGISALASKELRND